MSIRGRLHEPVPGRRGHVCRLTLPLACGSSGDVVEDPAQAGEPPYVAALGRSLNFSPAKNSVVTDVSLLNQSTTLRRGGLFTITLNGKLGEATQTHVYRKPHKTSSVC